MSQAQPRKRAKRANVKPAKGFTRQFKGGPAAHKETVRRARDAERIGVRRVRAWSLLLGGATFDQIGEACGVSNYTAWHDCYAYFEGLRERGLDQAELERARQNGQIDAVVLSHWRSKHQKASADIILRALERKARLNGLDRQRDGDRGYTYEQVQGLLLTLRDAMLAAFTEPELRGRIVEVLDRLGGRPGEAKALEARTG